MTDINKQKFLAELGKLLTFMYEEDRQLALSLYSDIFDQADDQQALMNALVSPTRQAVVIARAYNAKERKLQIHSQFRDEDEEFGGEDGETPAFIQAICANLPFEFKAEEEDEVSADQFSLFDDNSEDAAEEELLEEEAPAEEPAEEKTEAQEDTAERAAEAEPEYDNISAETAEAPALSSEAEEEEVPADEAEDDASAESTEDEEIDSELDEMEKDISEEAEAEEPSVESPEEDSEVKLRAAAPAAAESRLKPRVALLILYIILAVPITALGIVILLIPTLFFLLLAAGVIYSGSLLLVSAFGTFSMFSDIMVVLGSATVVLALGLLFFWIFIWFIGGAMAALVRLSLDLGRKWCYKEVPAV